MSLLKFHVPIKYAIGAVINPVNQVDKHDSGDV